MRCAPATAAARGDTGVGVIDPERGADGATVVVACAERFGAPLGAARAFQAPGRAPGDTVLAGAH